mmetsp:Transcript_21174/g.29942  ORF Transcript_21174/g.29942 Transcript_21174/m.29942 type:complete len:189 (-) Transcript_21174:375-941(-)
MKLSITLLFTAAMSASAAFVAPTHNNKIVDTTMALHMSSSSSRRDFVASASAAAALFGMNVSPAMAEPRPMYLTEPTDEFKASEAQRMEFKRAQLLLKKKMQDELDTLTAEKNDEDALAQDINNIRQTVIECGGMPLGIKKDDLVKQVRAKKAKGFWPTKVEYAYQGLINEIAYQQSPNKDKDVANPL